MSNEGLSHLHIHDENHRECANETKMADLNVRLPCCQIAFASRTFLKTTLTGASFSYIPSQEGKIPAADFQDAFRTIAVAQKEKKKVKN